MLSYGLLRPLARTRLVMHTCRVVDGDDLIPKAVQQARAFQVSWLIYILFAGARHRIALMEMMRGHLERLDVRLPMPLESYFGDELPETLLEIIGAQLLISNPPLADYFEAGWNMLYDLERNGGKRLGSIVSTLHLPQELLTSMHPDLEWVDKVHKYFEGVLNRAVT